MSTAILPSTAGQAGVEHAPIVNALSIDVEDYFQVSAFASVIARSDWDSMDCRVEANVERILALLADARTTATFFTLGWIAERYPSLVRAIADAGHEVASHGFGHERASRRATLSSTRHSIVSHAGRAM